MPDVLIPSLVAAVALMAGWLLGQRRARGELRRLEAELRERTEQALRLQVEAQVAGRNRDAEEENFKRIAAQALTQNTRHFLEIAKAKLEEAGKDGTQELDKRKQAIEALLKPLGENLKQLREFTSEIENRRQKAYGDLQQQLTGLLTATGRLGETSQSLVTALRGGDRARGRWGEVQLRNIVEMAGMSDHCDFTEQTVDASGNRPDMVVRLPGGGHIPVDSKVSLTSYLESTESNDASERARLLKAHAAALREHVRTLSRKDYGSAQRGEIDFTVMFVPSEALVASAFEQNPGLQDEALDNRVLITTPVTLVALLRTVAIYWRQEKMAANMEQAWEVARELHERVGTFQKHLGTIGRSLENSVKAYNRAVGSFERRVLPAGRKLEELKATKQSAGDLVHLDAIEEAPRVVGGDGSSAAGLPPATGSGPEREADSDPQAEAGEGVQR